MAGLGFRVEGMFARNFDVPISKGPGFREDTVGSVHAVSPKGCPEPRTYIVVGRCRDTFFEVP